MFYEKNGFYCYSRNQNCPKHEIREHDFRFNPKAYSKLSVRMRLKTPSNLAKQQIKGISTLKVTFRKYRQY
jgi:hypothetical protein